MRKETPHMPIDGHAQDVQPKHPPASYGPESDGPEVDYEWDTFSPTVKLSSLTATAIRKFGERSWGAVQTASQSPDIRGSSGYSCRVHGFAHDKGLG